eukprot:scaffold3501_cov122-Amphora_coffeaeformis.AAC.1
MTDEDNGDDERSGDVHSQSTTPVYGFPFVSFSFFTTDSGGSHSTILVTHDAHIWLARARAMKLRR